MSRLSDTVPGMQDVNQRERAYHEARQDPHKQLDLDTNTDDENAEPQQQVTGQLDRKPRERTTPDAASLDWDTVVASEDKDQFEEIVRPHLEALRADARHDIGYYRQNGELRTTDLNAEELVGETLVQAWQQRQHRPERLSLRGWLVGMQHRVLARILAEQHDYDDRKQIALESEVPLNTANYDVEEWIYEWYQPEDVMLWEELIPGSQPVDVELDDERLTELTPSHRRVVVLHDEFEMSLPEVAEVVNANVKEAAEMLQQARVNLRERMGSAPPPPDEA